MLKQEFQYLLAAIQFFTRIPVPLATPHDRVSLTHALKYFPLVGWLIGGLCALVLNMAGALWPPAIAVILCIAFGVLLTGALHEDGFADSCDGFGGGWNKEQVLRIMKDPRIGNFAAIGLILLLGLKIWALIELVEASPDLAMVALLLAHANSRWLVLPLPWLLDYVRDDQSSRAGSMVEHRFSGAMFGYASLFTLIPLLLLGVPMFYCAVFWAAVTVIALAFYFRHRLGGYSGDCLGAAQQVAEVVIYLAILASWNSL